MVRNSSFFHLPVSSLGKYSVWQKPHTCFSTHLTLFKKYRQLCKYSHNIYIYYIPGVCQTPPPDGNVWYINGTPNIFISVLPHSPPGAIIRLSKLPSGPSFFCTFHSSHYENSLYWNHIYIIVKSFLEKAAFKKKNSGYFLCHFFHPTVVTPLRALCHPGIRARSDYQSHSVSGTVCTTLLRHTLLSLLLRWVVFLWGKRGSNANNYLCL